MGNGWQTEGRSDGVVRKLAQTEGGRISYSNDCGIFVGSCLFPHPESP